MKAEPKHRAVSRALLSEIASGKYDASKRLPSESQIVRRFKVSRPTAARAIRDLQEQGLVQRRAGSGTYLSVAENAAPTLGSRQLGLIIPGLGNTEIFERICGEIASLARGHDYGLLWGSGARPKAGEASPVDEVEHWCDQFIQRQVAGIFFAPFEHVTGQEIANRRLADRISRAGIALVLLDRDLEKFPTRSEFDLVGIDNFTAGYQLAEHLIKLGSRRLTFIARPRSAPTVSRRFAGAREAMLSCGLEIPAEFMRVGDPEDPGFIDSIIGNDPDGAICANDETAAILIRALQARGRRVPRHVRVVGFDDVRYAKLISVPLTTVHQPCREIADVAFRVMLDRLADPTIPPRAIALTPSLVVRESCGTYKPAKHSRGE